MNKPLLKLVTASFLAVAASSAVAKEFVMSYDGFYDRLKVVNKGDFQYARVNFYISDIGTNEVCSIKNGTILTEKMSTRLIIPTKRNCYYRSINS